MLLCAKSPPITAILLNQACTWFTKIYFPKCLCVGMHACIFVCLPALIMSTNKTLYTKSSLYSRITNSIKLKADVSVRHANKNMEFVAEYKTLNKVI